MTTCSSSSSSTVESITIIRPDDYHHHFRDGTVLQYIVPEVAKTFGKVICMPNLKPPITTTEMALDYRDRILNSLKAKQESNKNLKDDNDAYLNNPTSGANYSDFIPLMTLYLTDTTTQEEIRLAKASGHIYACKLYPAGATTNSTDGVTEIENIYPVLETMAEVGLVLCVHSEVTNPEVDVFDREATFLERVTKPLISNFPHLKIVVEHLTTKEGVDLVMESGENVAATITPQHLLYNRNALFQGGLRPHLYCLPILKGEEHRRALTGAIKSGSPKFFLGTDSAPHAIDKKESCCGAAGCFSGLSAIELYADIFEKNGCLENLENFSSVYGSNFYGLPENQSTITLERKTWMVPESWPFLIDEKSGVTTYVKPLKAGESLEWHVKF